MFESITLCNFSYLMLFTRLQTGLYLFHKTCITMNYRVRIYMKDGASHCGAEICDIFDYVYLDIMIPLI